MIVRSPYFSPRIPLGNCMTAYAAHIPVSTRPTALFETSKVSMMSGMSGLTTRRATYVPKNAVIVSPSSVRW
jgi:hypothetical protein